MKRQPGDTILDDAMMVGIGQVDILHGLAPGIAQRSELPENGTGGRLSKTNTLKGAAPVLRCLFGIEINIPDEKDNYSPSLPVSPGLLPQN